MDVSFHVGQKVVYTKAGEDHISAMDEYIGEVLTIGGISSLGLWLWFDEDGCNYRFDAKVVVPLATKVR